MMKFKKIAGIAVAGCMALTSLIATAGAANSPLPNALARSEHAGQMMEINAVNADMDGTYVQKTVKVNIPDGATVREEKQIVTAAATQALGRNIQVQSAPIAGDRLGIKTGVQLKTSSSTASTTSMCTAIASDEYEVLVVYVSDIYGNATGLNIRVWTSAIGATYGENGTVYKLNNSIYNGACTVMFVNGRATDGKTFWIAKGDSVSAYGSTTGGTCSVTTELYGQR